MGTSSLTSLTLPGPKPFLKLWLLHHHGLWSPGSTALQKSLRRNCRNSDLSRHMMTKWHQMTQQMGSSTNLSTGNVDNKSKVNQVLSHRSLPNEGSYSHWIQVCPQVTPSNVPCDLWQSCGREHICSSARKVSRMPHAQFSSLSARISRIQFAHSVSGIVIWTFCTWSSFLYLVSSLRFGLFQLFRLHQRKPFESTWPADNNFNCQRNCGQESQEQDTQIAALANEKPGQEKRWYPPARQPLSPESGASRLTPQLNRRAGRWNLKVFKSEFFAITSGSMSKEMRQGMMRTLRSAGQCKDAEVYRV